MAAGAATLDAASVLEQVHVSRELEQAAAADQLGWACRWADLHPLVPTADDHATFTDCGYETGMSLTGEGVPAVAASCVAELAAVLGVSTESGQRLLAHALELRHRLPRLWALVHSGRVAPWRARPVADATLALSAEAADWVDVQVAAVCGRVGPAQLERTVLAAITRFMPDEATRRAAAAADARRFDVVHDITGAGHGLSHVSGALELPDALDLDAAVTAGAHALADLGCEQSLDVRRSMALGDLARRQPVMPTTAPTGGDRIAPSPVRPVTLYLHLSADALGTACSGDPVAHVQNTRAVVTAEQVRAWCGRPDTRITIRPVIDLHEQQTATGYEVPGRLREQLALRDRTCTFRWCERPAHPEPSSTGRWSLDADHTVPWGAGGPTSTDNLALLCRTHHRLKTFTRWRYHHDGTGVLHWTSPHGRTYLRDRTGSRAGEPARGVPSTRPTPSCPPDHPVRPGAPPGGPPPPPDDPPPF